MSTIASRAGNEKSLVDNKAVNAQQPRRSKAQSLLVNNFMGSTKIPSYFSGGTTRGNPGVFVSSLSPER